MLLLPVGKSRYSILNSNARINIWEGAVRSSKTVSAIIRWIDYILTGPEGSLLMVGKTRTALEKNVLEPIQALVGNENYLYHRVQGDVTIYGRKIDLLGAADEKAKDKIQGRTLAGAFVDEATLVPESFFTMLLSRLSIPGAKLFATLNPESPRHWLKVKFLDRQDQLSLKVFHFTLEDNPSLDPGYIEQLKREYTGLWYDRYILGKWVAATGCIYDQLDYSKHVVSALPQRFNQIFVSVDYGTANPTCFLMLGKAFGKTYVIKEFYYDSRKEGRQKTDKEYAEEMIRFLDGYHPQKILVDPSASSFITQLKAFRKFRVAYGDNAVVDGIRITSKALSDGKLFIHDSCTKLLEELHVYAWDQKAQDHGIDQPVKVHDHACDALRYACVDIFGRDYGKMLYDLPR